MSEPNGNGWLSRLLLIGVIGVPSAGTYYVTQSWNHDQIVANGREIARLQAEVGDLKDSVRSCR